MNAPASCSRSRPRLLFISTMFLHPVDTGARIRTTQILRSLRGGIFETTLVSPATGRQLARWRSAVEGLADHYVPWLVPERGAMFGISRMRHLASALPIPVVTDYSPAGAAVVGKQLEDKPDVVVVDFPHAMVLLPPGPVSAPIVLFTHNVEAEIFARHRDVSRDHLRRLVWENQRGKMARYERAALKRADAVVAVSERDAAAFARDYSVNDVQVIPTGVDLDFFQYRVPNDQPNVVFTGSMDWMANIDGIQFLLRDVWPIVQRERPESRMTVVGRNPPDALVQEARRVGYRWDFTGWVQETRPWVWESPIFVVPLRVGGGTRLKVWEAMALGSVVVSTELGVEGLPVVHNEHCLLGNDPSDLARHILSVMDDASLRRRLSRAARQHVEANFGFRRAGAVFEAICARALGLGSELAGAPAADSR